MKIYRSRKLFNNFNRIVKFQLRTSYNLSINDQRRVVSADPVWSTDKIILESTHLRRLTWQMRPLISLLSVQRRKDAQAHPLRTGNHGMRRNAINVNESINKCRQKALLLNVKTAWKGIWTPLLHRSILRQKVGNVLLVLVRFSVPPRSNRAPTSNTRYAKNECTTMKRVDKFTIHMFILSV